MRGSLQTFNDILLANAIERASSADERSKILDVTAANLKKENLALEAQIQPRMLNKEKRRVLSAACRGFSKLGLRIEIVPQAIDLDGGRLARQLATALPNAELSRPILSMGGVDEGLIVSGDRDIQTSVKLLVDALNSVGIVSRIGPTFDSSGRSDLKKLIAIRVGLKPLLKTAE